MNEKPRCANCGHRRIHHYVGVAGNRAAQAHEVEVPCSMPVDDFRCSCTDYQPARVLELVR